MVGAHEVLYSGFHERLPFLGIVVGAFSRKQDSRRKLVIIKLVSGRVLRAATEGEAARLAHCALQPEHCVGQRGEVCLDAPGDRIPGLQAFKACFDPTEKSRRSLLATG